MRNFKNSLTTLAYSATKMFYKVATIVNVIKRFDADVLAYSMTDEKKFFEQSSLFNDK